MGIVNICVTLINKEKHEHAAAVTKEYSFWN